MKRDYLQTVPLILYLAAAYASGILIAYSFDVDPLPSAIIIILALLLWAAHTIFQVRTGANSSVMFSVIVSVLVFFLLGVLFAAVKVDLLRGSMLKELARGRRCVNIYGTVVGECDQGADSRSCTLRVAAIKDCDKSFRTSEFVRVTIERGRGKKLPPLLGGEKVAISGIKPVRPSSETYRRYLYNKEIQALCIADSSQVSVIEKAPYYMRLIALIRNKVRKKAFEFLRPDQAGLLIGILLGDKKHISSLTQTSFAKTGVSHIIAVSGLHVGMLALLGLGLARVLRLKVWQKHLFTIGLVVFYALITGCRPSVLRASLIIVIGIIGWLKGKERHLVAAISAAALILLLYNPFFLFDVAFQLSFAAVFAIAFIAPELEYQLAKSPLRSNRLIELFLVSIAVQIGIAPIAVYYFQELSIVSAVANVAIVPVVAPILALGLTGSAFGCISSFLARLVYAILGMLLSFVIRTASLFASLPFSSLTAGVSLPVVAFYYIALFGVLVFMRQRKIVFRQTTLLFVSLAVPTCLIWWQVLTTVPPGDFHVTYFDVGQGDAALIRSPQGDCIVIDGGQDPYTARNLLSAHGVCKIDMLVLSHPHADHLNGLVELVESSNIGLVLIGAFHDASPKYREFKAAIHERGIPCITVKEGMRFKIGPDLVVTVLSDPSPISSDVNVNNLSIVAKVAYKDMSLLFPGDIESEEERELLDWKQELRSSVLKVSHHGSSNAANAAFLARVQPKVAIISVGKDNRFGHPASSTVETLRRSGAAIYRTDRDGHVTITSDGKNFAVSASR